MAGLFCAGALVPNQPGTHLAQTQDQVKLLAELADASLCRKETVSAQPPACNPQSKGPAGNRVEDYERYVDVTTTIRGAVESRKNLGRLAYFSRWEDVAATVTNAEDSRGRGYNASGLFTGDRCPTPTHRTGSGSTRPKPNGSCRHSITHFGVHIATAHNARQRRSW